MPKEQPELPLRILNLLGPLDWIPTSSHRSNEEHSGLIVEFNNFCELILFAN